MFAYSVADPGFPLVDRCPTRRFLAKMYAKMKELGPVGRGEHVQGKSARSANDTVCLSVCLSVRAITFECLDTETSLLKR